MPVISREINTGDPVTERNGLVIGVVRFNFDDGRQVQKRIGAASVAEWNAKLDVIQAKIELQVAESDASKDIADSEITATGQATQKQRAVAYLRKAYSERDPLTAYRLFERFNAFRQANGWTLAQVQAALSAEGLTAEEWTNMRDAYSYLSGKVAEMQAYEPVKNSWEARP